MLNEKHEIHSQPQLGLILILALGKKFLHKNPPLARAVCAFDLSSKRERAKSEKNGFTSCLMNKARHQCKWWQKMKCGLTLACQILVESSAGKRKKILLEKSRRVFSSSELKYFDIFKRTIGRILKSAHFFLPGFQGSRIHFPYFCFCGRSLDFAAFAKVSFCNLRLEKIENGTILRQWRTLEDD